MLKYANWFRNLMDVRAKIIVWAASVGRADSSDRGGKRLSRRLVAVPRRRSPRKCDDISSHPLQSRSLIKEIAAPRVDMRGCSGLHSRKICNGGTVASDIRYNLSEILWHFSVRSLCSVPFS
jgi:hypothetical protein